MDDTQQAQPTVNSQQNTPTSMGDLAGAMPTAPGMPGGMAPGGDLSVPTAGMTPPPAMPMGPDPVQPAAPAMPTFPPAGAKTHEENLDDAAYVEDVLGEILDSLDRIEAKLEALEKKTA